MQCADCLLADSIKGTLLANTFYGPTCTGCPEANTWFQLAYTYTPMPQHTLISTSTHIIQYTRPQTHGTRKHTNKWNFSSCQKRVLSSQRLSYDEEMSDERNTEAPCCCCSHRALEPAGIRTSVEHKAT